jgi:Kef-type K+ transport system membrane component KefB
MKSFIVACVAIIVIAVGAAVVLDRYQQSTEVAYTTTGVRI